MIYIPEQETTSRLTARLVSFSREIPTINLLGFLRTAPQNTQRIYWENKRFALSFAGYGIAAEITARGEDRINIVRHESEALFADAIVEGSSQGIKPRLFGGFAFQQDFNALEGVWQAFPSAYFVLPRYLVTRMGQRTWLTVNAVVKPGSESIISDELAWMINRICSSRTSINSEYGQTWMENPSISYPLERDLWTKQITASTDRIKAGELQKVVLSRTCDVTFNDSVDPLYALERLESRYADCFRFLIEPQPESAFFGATPELLGYVDGKHLETAALAGSIARGQTPESDAKLAQDLFNNPKERLEHALVADAVRDLITPMTRWLDAPQEPQIFKLSNIQHLFTPFEGELKQNSGILSIVETLHPTPALGGYPQKAAVQAIAQTEPIARGWYASPVGWFDASGSGMFAVAIRSAVSHKRTARLYAGVGIVRDSDPSREWDETRLKFRPMLDALGVNGQS